mmetsp:Transcript_37504/g.78563  ORF Transcript_37504/g.78563 Transcript_37504/m.78563 type:complete len:883 (+) Transcript_37504:154-2802(+)
MPLPPPPKDLFAQIKAKNETSTKTNSSSSQGNSPTIGGLGNNALLASLKSRQAAATASIASIGEAKTAATTRIGNATNKSTPAIPPGKLFVFDETTKSFHFDVTSPNAIHARLSPDTHGNDNVDIIVPLAPCAYRMTDYTYSKKEPVELHRCVNKLGVLRCLDRECKTLNSLLWSRLHPIEGEAGSMEEDELGKSRFMELLSNCGVYQKVSELILSACNKASDAIAKTDNNNNNNSDDDNSTNPYRIPQVRVEGIASFLSTIETLSPALSAARAEISQSSTVSFRPGLGELFSPGSRLVCFPEGMEGTPLGVRCVQSWYDEEINRATNKVKRKFVLVVEFLVSVGTELVFVAASEVYPEFHDAGRSIPLRDLNHRRLDPLLPDDGDGVRGNSREDAVLVDRMQCRGEFYASVATDNHYLEYHPNSFFPIRGGFQNNNSVRPLAKGGRVMVDVSRGHLAGHVPVRGSSDGMSDTVKEAMKLFDQNKRTGVAVPFRTAILPGFDSRQKNRRANGNGVRAEGARRGDSDRDHLWMAWPMLTGFSFTARCWGKLLLSLPKPRPPSDSARPAALVAADDSPKRPSIRKMGVELAGLGGVGQCGNVNYISFHEKAFDQLVLADEKKELIRAVARNAGGGSKFFDDEDSDDEDDEDEIGLDVVANKGAASIFLLSGPPGCGKTLTAEAIAELLKKPLYVVTAGDLGITASEVEKNLGGVLDLCSTWDALVLVDEADIFLETRSSTEIERNALVCVMLRLLEYYSGCLFLSSNRDANSIDAAIASRITVMLSYPPLDVDGRAKVWRNLVELVPPCPKDTKSNNPRKVSKYRMDFTSEEYQNLASGYSLNGRQIKNAIVLARSLARERGLPLSIAILKRAVTAVAGDSASL